MSAPKYHLTSYGCQMNKLDSELVETKLQQRGYVPAAEESEADVVLINTCSVRQHAEDRVWSKLGKLRVRVYIICESPAEVTIGGKRRRVRTVARLCVCARR